MKTQDMTAAQLAAVNEDAPQILCVAGPGAGKTTVLAARIRRLVESGVDPAKIVAITYTNAAARNLEERMPETGWYKLEDFSACKIKLGHAGTLHSFALRMLREHGEGIGYGARIAVIDEDAARGLLESKAKTLGCKSPIDRLMEVRKKGRPARGLRLTIEELCVAAYYDDLAEAGIVDFDLILTEFLRLLTEGVEAKLFAQRFEHVLVDEVQDSAETDWAIYRALPIRNKFLVGDPDQAIFGFRGGRQDLMMRFAKEPETKLLWLEENFRCAMNVCRAANDLIAHNANRLDKQTVAVNGALFGEVHDFLNPHATDGAEVGAVVEVIKNHQPEVDGTVAVLSRTNALASEFRDALRAAGCAVVEPPKPDLPRDWALARALTELLAQPDNNALAEMFLAASERAKGFSDKSATGRAHALRLEAVAQGKSMNGLWWKYVPNMRADAVIQEMARRNISLESRMRAASLLKDLPADATALDLALAIAGDARAEEPPRGDGVDCLTVHAAKGLEWDVVFLVGFEDEAWPGKREEVEESRRLAFVAITRARRTVYISYAATRRASWGNRRPEPRHPSRFLTEIFGGKEGQP